MKHFFIIILLFLCFPSYGGKGGGGSSSELGLPTIAWPAPLFSFGQDVLYAETLSPEAYVYYTDGPNNNYLEINWRMLYGITNKWVVLAFPSFFQVIEDGVKSAGMGDFGLGTEYAFYQDMSEDHITQFTAVGQLLLPTGNPEVSRSTTSVFLGGTAANISEDWYTFGSVGIQFSAKRKDISYGDIVLYELGLGRKIFHKKESYFAYILCELNGSFTQHVGATNTSSLGHVAGPGGNQIFFGPSLLIGNDQFILYVGFQYPIAQTIFAPEGGFKSSFQMGYALDIYIEF